MKGTAAFQEVVEKEESKREKVKVEDLEVGQVA